MAGVYIHVPFCKVKCHYCDFHFSVNNSYQDQLVDGLLIEIEKQQNFFKEESVETIYFGGGTPSLLTDKQLNRLLKSVYNKFQVANKVEITLECNPDDLSIEKLKVLKDAGVNRLSIGLQSFDDQVLTFMNRAHNAKESQNCLELAKSIGFDNITADLIYGIPDSDLYYWKDQLKIFESFEIPHLSAYCLTIEPNTVFGTRHKKGTLNALPDEQSIAQFDYLMEFAELNDLEHYEISNFAKNGFISKHNSAYWKGKKYLGIGPSAHSYDGDKRYWNIANNHLYMQRLKDDEVWFEQEELSVNDKFNEYILTRLRTKWGVIERDLKEISEKYFQEIAPELTALKNEGLILCEKDTWTLTKEGKYRADAISADLFV